MGADIKSLRTRIKSVKSTLQLTKAMGLVASSKIRKAQINRVKAKEYENAVSSIINVLTASRECEKSVYMTPLSDKEKLIVISGDRGMAGGYNANIVRFARDNANGDFLPIGKKACERYGKEFKSSEHFSYSDALELARELCSDFTEGNYGKISILYTEYISMMSQTPVIKQILPLEKGESKASSGAIFEPNELTVLDSAVPTYIAGIIFSAIKESFACEVISRRNAMDSAGKNASAMIDELMLKYNRARQGSITQEITEIVAGSNS